MKKINLIILGIVSLHLLSCKKEIVWQKNEMGTVENTRVQASDEMSQLPMFDLSQLDNRDNTNTAKSDEVAWGIGEIESTGNGRVFKSTNLGVSWSEPNTAARLKYVEVAADGSVWGVTSNRNIWKWNGTSWALLSGLLDQVSPVSSTTAIGVSFSNNGKLYITTNGGTSWSQFTTIENVEWVSVGSSTNNIWIIRRNNVNQRVINKWNTSTLVWDFYTTYGNNNVSVSAMLATGAWRVNSSNDVYRSDNGVNFFEPNTSATLNMISGIDSSVAWGLGSGTTKRIFRTTNGGANWAEPNSAARLTHISVN